MTTLTRFMLPVLCGGMLAAGVAACASAPIIPVEASRADFDALVGEWDGTYTSRDTGRSGSIWFKLIAGEDHAHGDVLMTARGRSEPYYRYPPNDWPASGRPGGAPQVLTIRFVRASAGTVDGRLDTYWDPDCGCEAVTTFRGRLSGDRLEGTFNTRLGVGGQANGQWTAYRRRVGEPAPEKNRHD